MTSRYKKSPIPEFEDPVRAGEQFDEFNMRHDAAGRSSDLWAPPPPPPDDAVFQRELRDGPTGEQFSAYGSYPTEDDHPYCELEADGFQSTTEPATMSAQDLIERFRRAHAAGWPGGDRDVSVSTKGRVVAKQCRRCGATSTGGGYCPNGCGKI